MADVRTLLRFAVNVARRITRDPEGESAAGNALARALRTYDGRTHIKGWVTYCVRREVWSMLRRTRHPKRAEGGAMVTNVHNSVEQDGARRDFFDKLPGRQEADACCPIEELLGEETRDLLFDRFVDETSYKHIAEARGLTWYQVQLKLNAALSRLRESQWARLHAPERHDASL